MTRFTFLHIITLNKIHFIVTLYKFQFTRYLQKFILVFLKNLLITGKIIHNLYIKYYIKLVMHYKQKSVDYESFFFNEIMPTKILCKNIYTTVINIKFPYIIVEIFKCTLIYIICI